MLFYYAFPSLSEPRQIQINLKLKFVNCNQAPLMPLETAEQFLLTLGSISNLEARLKLWTFKLDFKVGVNFEFNI